MGATFWKRVLFGQRVKDCITLLLVGTLLAALLGGGGVLYLFFRSELVATEQEALERCAANQKKVLEDWLQERLNEVVFLARCISLVPPDTLAVRELLREYGAVHHHFCNLALWDLSGRLVAVLEEPPEAAWT